MDLIDIGVNLAGKQFADDRKQVVERAVAAGVRRLIVTGTSESASAKGVELVSRAPGTIYTTVGVHPHSAKDYTARTETALRRLAASPGVVAIGECGLDFDRDLSPRSDQESAFEAQLSLAVEMGLPVFLHERDAFQRFHEILKEWRPKLVGAVVHCFTGEGAALKAYLDLDCHIGITGWICDDRRGFHLRTLVRKIPPDRLMLETDAPWLTPRDLPAEIRLPVARRNEPFVLPYICRYVASSLKKAPEQVAQETTAAAERFFRLIPGSDVRKETS